MNTIVAIPRYERYKASDVEYLGNIPYDWSTIKFKFLANTKKGKLPEKITSENGKNLLPYLSMEYLRGGSANQFVEGKNAIAVEDNELLVLWDGSNAGEFIKSRKGVVSSTLATVHFHSLNKNFSWYACHVTERLLRGATIGMGIPHVDGDELKNSLLAIPSDEEQTTIANFLDKKTTQIDQAIAIKTQQIALLKERQQILIQNAVTKGLNPNAPMKNSGVDWLGEIPKHWEVKRLKYVLDERNERSKTGEEPLFMVSQVHGLVVRSEYHDKTEIAVSNIDNKIVYQNDLVFNKLKAHLGVFFKSTIEFKGLVSPDYAVYRPKVYISDLKYLEYLFRHPSYIEQFIIRATGIVEGLIRLYTDDLFSIHIPIPPLNEQKEILERIELITKDYDHAVDLQNQQIEKLKEYKASLINSAVTGKIKITPALAGMQEPEEAR